MKGLVVMLLLFNSISYSQDRDRESDLRVKNEMHGVGQEFL